MEINGASPLISSSSTNTMQRVDSAQTTERAQTPVGDHLDSDRLELSSRSREVTRFKDMVLSAPDIREGKVDQIRKGIESGTYNVKADKIAEKLIGGNLLDEVI